MTAPPEHRPADPTERQVEELLRQEQIKYRDLFEAAPEAYLVNDAAGAVLETNRAMFEIHATRDAALEDINGNGR